VWTRGAIMSDPNGFDATHGSEELYHLVKTAFVAKRWSLNRWCRENAVTFTTARNSLLGWGDTPKLRDIRAKIVKAAGLED
jgi:hypothetical protein